MKTLPFLCVLFLAGLFPSWGNEEKTKKLAEKINRLEQEIKALRMAQKTKSTVKNIPILMGRLMVDYSFLDADGSLRSVENTSAKNGSGFRRARLGVRGNFGRVFYQMNLDFADSTPEFKSTHLKWVTKNKKGIWVGHMKEPFGLEQISSSKYSTFMENSLLKAFYPEYSTGLMFTENDRKKRLSYALGLFYDSDDSGKSSTSNEDDLNMTARVNYLIRHKSSGKELLHLGWSHSRRNLGSIQYAVKAENDFWDRKFLDTGAIFSRGAIQNGLEFIWHNKELQIQAEHVRSEVKALSGIDPIFHGTYVQASYFLTGEHRPFYDRYRTFSRVRPLKDFDGNGGYGAWQIALRYSTVDLDDLASRVQGGKQAGTTYGVNWYLNAHSRVMVNHTVSRVRNTGGTRSTALRFQVDF